MEILSGVVNVAAGIGSLVCFIIVLIHFFQSDQTGLGIACIVLFFVCGIGALIAFVKGWMDGLGTVMYVWTACILVGLLSGFAFRVGGAF
ncbi:MAG: hypothetical protein DWQ37_11080 [Planctomycetota bacterium]|nr:MAG: hypothetical protein DWQ37_11080 [Planctomycetota bacterium]